MVQIEGTYEFVSQDNYLEYIKSVGLTDEQAQKIAESKSSIVISPLDGDKLTISYGAKQTTLVVNQEIEHTLSIGHVVKTTTTINGNVITFKSTLAGGALSEERVFTITDSGLKSVTINSKGVKAVREYKRV